MINHHYYYIDIVFDSSIGGSKDNSTVESSIIETIVVDSAPPVAESSIIETILVDSAPPEAESRLEFQLNPVFGNDDHISMWLEEQGVHGDGEIQGRQDRRVQDRRYLLRWRSPTAKAAGLG
jgi:hypothetical protein